MQKGFEGLDDSPTAAAISKQKLIASAMER